jgi:hypothetical protein
MAHVYKSEEWQSGSGIYWYCNDTSDLAGKAGLWWIPCRILNISPADYVSMLIDEFKVDKISYNIETNTLYFCWKSQTAMRKYKNFINKKARETNFLV